MDLETNCPYYYSTVGVSPSCHQGIPMAELPNGLLGPQQYVELVVQRKETSKAPGCPLGRSCCNPAGYGVDLDENGNDTIIGLF